MLELLPQEMSFKIMELLLTKDRIRLMLVSRAWRDLTRLCVNWHSISVKILAKNVSSLTDWMSSLDYRTASTLSSIKITATGFVPSDYGAPFELLNEFSSLTRLQLRETHQAGRSFLIDDNMLGYLTCMKQLKVLDLDYGPVSKDESGAEDWMRAIPNLCMHSLKSFAAFDKLESLSCAIHIGGARDSVLALAPELRGLTALRALSLHGIGHMLAVNGTLREIAARLTFLNVDNLKHNGQEEVIAAPNLQHCEISHCFIFEDFFLDSTIAFSEALVSLSIHELMLSLHGWNLPSSLTKLKLVEEHPGQERSAMAAIPALAALPNLQKLQIIEFDWTGFQTSEALEPLIHVTSLISLDIDLSCFGISPISLSNCSNSFDKLTELKLRRLAERTIVVGQLRSFPCLEVATINAFALGQIESQTLRSLEVACEPNLHRWLDMNTAANELFGQLPKLESLKLRLENSILQEVEAVVRRLSKLPSLQDLVLTYEKEKKSKQPVQLATSRDGFIETCCWALDKIHTLKSLELNCAHDVVHLFRVGLPAAVKLRVLCAGLDFGAGFGLHPATRHFLTI